ncbi:CoA-binding protein [Patulibacter sp. SYSU D01012]|uniref:CoA-binding protein n=1 Tax=Patulibacter sp. SYSU D01012 TaxID=2817381 RepID=UPI001B30D4E5|nr:CoA-binding protein [Patulibacter sp. SYSU D01012]
MEPEDDRLARILRDARTVAVVGASNAPHKPAHTVPRYLQRQGYRVLPVNPRGGEILGVPAATSLTDVAEPVDVVEVFRPGPDTPPVARQAVEIGAKVLWLQLGIVSEEARRIAEEGGVEVVMDRCMAPEHARLGIGPVGPPAA